MTHLEHFAALPESVQEQLVRIARAAAGMSAAEKSAAMSRLALFVQAGVSFGSDDDVASAELAVALARVVKEFDLRSGVFAAGDY